MKFQTNKHLRLSISSMLSIISIIMIVLWAHVTGASQVLSLKIIIFSILIVFIISFYSSRIESRIKNLVFFNSIMTLSYSISLFYLLVTNGKSEFYLWLGAGLCIGMIFDSNLGYIIMNGYLLLASILGNWEAESIISTLFLITLLRVLDKYMKKLTELLYSVIVVISIQSVITFIRYDFNMNELLNITYLYYLLSGLGTIVFSYSMLQLYEKISNMNIEKNKNIRNKCIKNLSIQNKNPESKSIESKIIVNKGIDIKNNENETIERKNIVNINISNHNTIETNINAQSYKEILNPKFPLLKRLYHHSTKLYNHSLKICEISGLAAEAIGANTEVAKVAGLYHEIGKITNEKDYITEGIKLAKEYHLPAFTEELIRQHNIKSERPKSVEAAIVMLTINIVDTKNYMDKIYESNSSQEKKIMTIDKLVDSIFQMRLIKGSLNECGMSLLQYHDLINFYKHKL